MQAIADMFKNLSSQLSTVSVIDIIDIVIVTVILYYTLRFVRERRAGKLALGIAVLLAVMLLSEILEMRTVNFIFRNIFQVGLMALIILFQPELRSGLEKMGGGSLRGFRSRLTNTAITQQRQTISVIAEAIVELSRNKTGALVVIERSTKIEEIIKTGTVIDARISTPMFTNVFFNKAPMHDGAAVIRNWRIYACGCILPLSSNSDVDYNLGTRHRAGIGVSEISDVVVLIVSEETGIISVAIDGELKRGFSQRTLGEYLYNIFDAENEHVTDKVKNKLFSKKKGDEDSEK